MNSRHERIDQIRIGDIFIYKNSKLPIMIDLVIGIHDSLVDILSFNSAGIVIRLRYRISDRHYARDTWTHLSKKIPGNF